MTIDFKSYRVPRQAPGEERVVKKEYSRNRFMIGIRLLKVYRSGVGVRGLSI